MVISLRVAKAFFALTVFMKTKTGHHIRIIAHWIRFFSKSKIYSGISVFSCIMTVVFVRTVEYAQKFSRLKYQPSLRIFEHFIRSHLNKTVTFCFLCLSTLGPTLSSLIFTFMLVAVTFLPATKLWAPSDSWLQS